MKILFTATPTAAQGNADRRFVSGRVYDLPEASVRHWLDRGVATVAVRDLAAPAAAAAAPPAKEPLQPGGATASAPSAPPIAAGGKSQPKPPPLGDKPK